ncbi:MAG TPA: FixH family protein [Terriglobales bacterium]|nr:FixH family protein [Terriglobales bacterium]
MTRDHGISVLLLAVVVAGCSKPKEQIVLKEEATTAAVQTAPAQQASGGLDVSPSELKSGEMANLRFVLKDKSGELIKDASVQATLKMPMGKSEMRDAVDLKWNGTSYSGKVKASMAGTWDVTVDAKRDGKLLLSIPAQIDVK